MESGMYRLNGHASKKKKFGKKSLIFLSFLIVVGIILFSAFADDFSFTGNLINSMNQNASINIKTSLLVPEMSLEGEYNEISFSVGKGNFVYLDGKKISLDELENKIIIRGFRGNIEISEENIGRMEGKISEIKINNLLINLESGREQKFSLSSDSKYSSLEIKENVFLKDITFMTSGNLNFEGNSLSLNLENLRLKNYLGSLRVENKKLILEGFAQDVEIEGRLRKISLSSN